jgi:hypothetical protein
MAMNQEGKVSGVKAGVRFVKLGSKQEAKTALALWKEMLPPHDSAYKASGNISDAGRKHLLTRGVLHGAGRGVFAGIRLALGAGVLLWLFLPIFEWARSWDNDLFKGGFHVKHWIS